MSDDPEGSRRDDVIVAWLRRARHHSEADFWAWERVQDAGPNEKWRFVRALLAAADTDDVLSVVAAGPLEELIYAAGQWAKSGHPDWIDVIEAEARVSPKLREALAHVWPEDDDPPELWQRLDAVLGSAVANRHVRREMTNEETERLADMTERVERMQLKDDAMTRSRFEPPEND